jgi:hypothetical protein
MGLGKTIQAIALLAYMACEEGSWGPHLIVVPTRWGGLFIDFLFDFCCQSAFVC